MSRRGMAKLFASETAMQITLNAVRIHGGYGYSTEFDGERYFRYAPLMIVGEGTNEILRGLITASSPASSFNATRCDDDRRGPRRPVRMTAARNPDSAGSRSSSPRPYGGHRRARRHR